MPSRKSNNRTECWKVNPIELNIRDIFELQIKDQRPIELWLT